MQCILTAVDQDIVALGTEHWLLATILVCENPALNVNHAV